MYYVVCKSCRARWESADQPRSCINEECEASWLDLPMFADKTDADRVAAERVAPTESDDVYLGSFFDIARHGENWTIWRLVNDEGKREAITLSQTGMDDLRDYFADFYVEDRAEAREEIAQAFDLDPTRHGAFGAALIPKDRGPREP